MMSQPSPEQGASWQPAISGNRVFRDGEAVVKDFGDRVEAFARERALLDRLGALPIATVVPRLLPARRFGELRYAFLEGVSGATAIESGLAREVLRDMGMFLCRLHTLESQGMVDILRGEGPAIVHGDFAHHNIVVNGETGALVGVLDWEEARYGRPALDLAWCEWQFTTRFPHLRSAIKHLYHAYGDGPDPDERDEALRERLTELRRRSTTQSEAEARRPQGDAHLHQIAFSTRAETAAFVAALSRFLSGPASTSTMTGVPLVWADDVGAGGPRYIYLSDAALIATKAAFGTPPHIDRIGLSEIPASCRLLYGAGVIPAWGVAEAARHLVSNEQVPASD